MNTEFDWVSSAEDRTFEYKNRSPQHMKMTQICLSTQQIDYCLFITIDD